MILFASTEDGTNAWPGILLLPQGAKLDTTDGAHRRSQIVEILNSGKISDDAKGALKRNAVDVKIVFESSRSDSHQDFADCGKAKAIPKSMVTTFDIRDRRNALTRELVKANPFLTAYVDATASNVNLSSKSRMIWSTSAIRMFIGHVIEHHPDTNLSDDEKTEGASDFVEALVRHLLQLKALDKARKEKNAEVTTGALRDVKGGDVALRGVGMAVFARAFLYCKEEEIDYDVMAAKLATIDWHLLSCERSGIPPRPDLLHRSLQGGATDLGASPGRRREPVSGQFVVQRCRRGVAEDRRDPVRATAGRVDHPASDKPGDSAAGFFMPCEAWTRGRNRGRL